MNSIIEEIWKRFHKELKSYIVSKVGNTNDADDILQNAFLRIIKDQDKVESAHNLKQYLYGIIRNATIDFHRSQKFQMAEQPEAVIFSDGDEKSLNYTIAECCLRPFIEKLPEKYREALIMSELNNISQKEMAKLLNISHSGAKSRVQRGREMLKQLILSCCDIQSDAYGNLTGSEICKGDC